MSNLQLFILVYIVAGVISNISWTAMLGYSAKWYTTIAEILLWPLGWYYFWKAIRE